VDDGVATGTDGALPLTKSNPQASQKSASGSRAAPQLGHGGSFGGVCVATAAGAGVVRGITAGRRPHVSQKPSAIT
jgi:hypothetical protein